MTGAGDAAARPVPDASSGIGEGRAWLTVFILLLLAILASIDRNAISLMVDPIRASLGVSDLQMGLLQGPAFALFFLIGSLPMGWIVDRYSSRWTLYLGVTGWSLATIACGMAGSFWELMIARCLVGLGEAVLQPAGWTMVARIFPPRRLALAIGVLSAGAQIGAASSYLLGGYLIASAESLAGSPLPLVGQMAPWQLVFIAAGVPGVVAALLVFAVPAAPRQPLGSMGAQAPAQGESTRVRSFVRANWRFLGHHFTGFSLHAAAVFGAAAWVPTWWMRGYGMDVRSVGLTLALLAVPIGAAGVIFAGWWVDRRFAAGRRDAHLAHFANVALVMALVGGAGFGLGGPALVAIIAFAVMQFLQPFSGVSGAVLQIVTPAALRGRISAAYIMSYNAIGMVLGPSVIALLSEHVFGAERLGMAIACSYAGFGVLAWWQLRGGRRHAADAVQRRQQLDTDPAPR